MKNSPSAQLGDTLDLASEKTLLRVSTQREQCCHSAGSLALQQARFLKLAKIKHSKGASVLVETMIKVIQPTTEKAQFE